MSVIVIWCQGIGDATDKEMTPEGYTLINQLTLQQVLVTYCGTAVTAVRAKRTLLFQYCQ